ncbi:MAG: hypothetical protein JO170_01395 [Verrucomicrobia bacterium]|nr:hypothetical protein [Verrucomicrobiota bacterium]
MSENKTCIIVRVQDNIDDKEAVVAATVNLFAETQAQTPGGTDRKRLQKGETPGGTDRKRLQKGETGPDGRVRFDVSPGTYAVTTTAFGYDADSKDFEVKESDSQEVILPIPVGLKLGVGTLVDNQVQALKDMSLVIAGTPLLLTAETQSKPANVKYIFRVSHGRINESGREFVHEGENPPQVLVDTTGLTSCRLEASVELKENPSIFRSVTLLIAPPAAVSVAGPVDVAGRVNVAGPVNVDVTMRRTATKLTRDLPLWVVIRRSTEALRFDRYRRFMDLVLGGFRTDSDEFRRHAEEWRTLLGARVFESLLHWRFLPYNDVGAYRLLKVATEAFVLVNCGIRSPRLQDFTFTEADVADLVENVGVDGVFTLDALQNLNILQDLWTGNRDRGYLSAVNGFKTIMYLRLIRDKLRDVPIRRPLFGEESDLDLPEGSFGILETKLTNPCLLELIWSYWHEEGMLVQTMNAIALRFQNRRLSDRDPLANLEIDPIRPLNNLMWGYIQDDQHRLTLQRRSFEYDHHYGLRLEGRALPDARSADSRSKFIEAFHNLLHLCSVFFKQDDDTTFIADGFPVLNALKEVHRIVAEGAHNQFGDLPSTARIEMLMQQWLLARPEFREYLPTRIMVAYPEPWMDRVDAMKKLQNWTDSSIADFSWLARFGEQILLTIRYGAWSEVNEREHASNWARYWRTEIQGYIHSYRAVTGVDLTSEFTETRLNREAYLPPSVHLRRRLEAQGALPESTAATALPYRAARPVPARNLKERV